MWKRTLRIAAVLIAVLAPMPVWAHEFVDYFEVGETHLSARGYQVAREVAAYALQSPSKVLITAHEDGLEASTQTEARLDVWRGREMMLELMRLGVSPEVIDIEAKGVSQQARVAPEVAAEPLNRRVTVDVNPIEPRAPGQPPRSIRLSHIDQPLVFFDTNSTEVTRQARFILALAVHGHRPGDWRMIVRGYADTLGSVEANEALATPRAEAVARVLVQLGMPWADMEVIGGGDRLLARATPDERSEPLNRRVTVNFFLKPGAEPVGH
jgi:outer membrane protein OmpA-like peptidoglycan-associated protein